VGEIRVIVADDSAVIRAGVEALIALHDGARVVATASSLSQLRRIVADEFAAPGPADVVVTDIRMPPTHTDEGIAAACSLRLSHPWVGVVVLSQFADPAYLSRLMADGPQGRAYLLKDHVGDHGVLAAAVRAVTEGGSYVDAHVAATLVEREARRSSSPVAALTARELQILAAVATGLSNAAIAESLVITGRAVEKHINSIFAKLDLGDHAGYHRRVRAVLAYLDAVGPA
jgi:DNA-binding NarL/FixJ family response regulator